MLRTFSTRRCPRVGLYLRVAVLVTACSPVLAPICMRGSAALAASARGMESSRHGEVAGCAPRSPAEPDTPAQSGGA